MYNCCLTLCSLVQKTSMPLLCVPESPVVPAISSKKPSRHAYSKACFKDSLKSRLEAMWCFHLKACSTNNETTYSLGIFIVQVPKYTHSLHTLEPSNRNLFLPDSKWKAPGKSESHTLPCTHWQLHYVWDNWSNILNSCDWIFPYLYIWILSIKKYKF